MTATTQALKAVAKATPTRVFIVRGKPAIIFHKDIANRLGITPDWTTFNVSIVEGGLYLQLVDRRYTFDTATETAVLPAAPVHQFIEKEGKI